LKATLKEEEKGGLKKRRVEERARAQKTKRSLPATLVIKTVVLLSINSGKKF
jgi:hypothetical protein